jgi:1,4-alpha-glucan branching enzyme
MMSLKKQFDAKKKLCKVTFTLVENIADSSNRVNLVGDFNNWNIESIPMMRLKGGDYSVSINLEKGREYQFKYLVEGLGWLNEKEADKHVLNGFQTENSVVIV